MYLGIDIGGTKTLVASIDEQGNITEKVKFPTGQDYSKFLDDLKTNIGGLSAESFSYCGAGIPATVIDRERGVGVSFGNLPWKEAPVRDDIARVAGCPAVIENDAKVAGLSESMSLGGKYRKVLYVTVSTGIGFALVVNNVIDTSFGDAGGRALLLEHEGKMASWEDFASGKAIVRLYGKRASEIDDEATWRQISRDIAKGFIQLIATVQPEVIVIGGSVGVYFEKYGSLLAEELEKYSLPLVPLPKLMAARRPEEAVIYGCYELIKQEAGDGRSDS